MLPAEIFEMRSFFFFNIFAGKAHVKFRSNFENLHPVDELIELLIHFVKKCAEISDTLTYVSI